MSDIIIGSISQHWQKSNPLFSLPETAKVGRGIKAVQEGDMLLFLQSRVITHEVGEEPARLVSRETDNRFEYQDLEEALRLMERYGAEESTEREFQWGGPEYRPTSWHPHVETGDHDALVRWLGRRGGFFRIRWSRTTEEGVTETTTVTFRKS